MVDERSLEGLSAEELERLLSAKRRAERLRRFRAIVEEEGREASVSEELPGLLSTGQEGPVRREAGRGYRPPPSVTEVKVPFRPPQVPPSGIAFPQGALREEKRGRVWRRLRDRFLLLVELGALLGLIGVVVVSFYNLRLLNREVIQTRGQGSTATPVVLLPGSSFPPTSEMPAPYQHLVQGLTPIPIPTPGPEQATRIVIPAIDVDAPVVEGDGWEELKMGVGHHIGSVNPGERGNMVVSGHNDVFGEVFRRLGELGPGDEIIVYAGETPYRYLVREKRIVQPDEVSVMEPTTKATMTLITCYPYLIDTHRLVVIAELEGQ
ncbi:MAG: sortase [Anaerolineae bacterium]